LRKKKSEQYGYFYESLAPEKADRFMEPFLITMVPSEVKELSSHDGQEFIFVLEGEMRPRWQARWKSSRPVMPSITTLINPTSLSVSAPL
jgi:hypothetical protein